MPLYEYRCSSCSRTTEALQSFSDEPLTVCEDCGGELKKLLSSPAFQFKGSGWYVSDYGKGNAPAGEKPKEGSGDGAKGDSADSKSAEKASERADKSEKSEKSEKSGDKPSDKPAAAPADKSSGASASPAPKDGGKSSG